MKRALLIFSAFIVVVLTVSALSEFWADKPYSKWSAKDIKHLLSQSPWGKTTTLRTPIIKQVHRKTGQFSDLAGEGEGVADPTVEYSVYLRTARPVREALVRQAQIDEKYDEMSDADKKTFDKKWGQFLAAEGPDKIIVQVQYSSNTADIDRQLMNFWQNQTAATMREVSAMTWPDGRRVAPIAYWAARGAGREFQIAFARPEGYRDDGAISVEFQNPNVKVEGNSRIYTKFQLKELKYAGKVTY